MLKLIINADDFGYTEGVNYGIVEAHKHGIVRSTTIMPNMPAFEHAVALAKENLGLGVGVQLTVTAGESLLRTHKTIVDEQGKFINIHKALQNGDLLDLQEIEDEWFAQIRKVYESGLKPTHIDSHDHSHGEEVLLPIAAKIANYYHLPMRVLKASQRRKVSVEQYGIDALSVDFYDSSATLDKLLDIIDSARRKGSQSLEIMCHPAFIDAFLLKHSDYHMARTKELEVLTEPGLEDHLSSMNVVLANFATV